MQKVWVNINKCLHTGITMCRLTVSKTLRNLQTLQITLVTGFFRMMVFEVPYYSPYSGWCLYSCLDKVERLEDYGRTCSTKWSNQERLQYWILKDRYIIYKNYIKTEYLLVHLDLFRFLNLHLVSINTRVSI